MLINLRNALMAGKRPPYDAEVEYLFADGGTGAYINSGVLWKSSLRVKLTVARYQGTGYALQSFVGGRDVSAANAGYAIGFNLNAKFVSDNSGTRLTSSMNCDYYGIYTIDKKPNEVTISGNGQTETMTGGPSQTQQGTYPLYIFGLNNVGTAATTGMRLYSLQIWDNGVLVRDYIPVRKGTTGYLYDRVSGKMFGNAGTGDFVLGQDVVPVEYIESDGNAYINTGVIPADDIGARATFTVSALGTYIDNYVLGSRAVGAARFYLYNNEGSSFVKYGWGSMITTSSPVVLNQKITASLNYCNDRKFVFNASEVQSALPTADFSANVYPMFLFGTNFAGQQISSAVLHGRIYDCEITKGATPVRSFRSVRVGTEGAMMDVLTRRIYRNAGTGAFAYGNDLKYPIPSE